MIWIVLAIIAVGYFVVKAIQRNTQVNALIAQQQLQHKEAERIEAKEEEHRKLVSSPEYRKQQEVSTLYFRYLDDVMDYETWIVQNQIRLLNPPKQYGTLYDYKTGDWTANHVELTDPSAINKVLKYEITAYKQTIEDMTKDFKKKKKELGFEPEPLELTVSKYGLDEPFSGEDWIQEEGSWGMFKEKRQKLHDLKAELEKLKATKSKTIKKPVSV